MGGIFSSPKAPPMPAPEPFIAPVADTDQAQSRTEQIERRRRGRAGTVLTSERGLISLKANAQPKKSLLGE